MRTARREYSDYSPARSSTFAHSGSDAVVELDGMAGQNAPADVSMVPAPTRASIKVLVVDDDRSLREGCASVLQVEGYNVSSCGRGDEALELVRRTHFDIILVDLYMTPVPGMEILRAAIATDSSTVVVMVTGNPSVQSSIDALL